MLKLVRPHGPRILYLFHPCFLTYAKHIRHDFLVYHAYDLLSETLGWNATLESDEQQLSATADLVISSSQPIASVLAERCGRNAHVVPNGADVAAFLPKEPANREPHDIALIPKPRIGYIGRINQKVDFKLLYYLSENNQDWQIVLVGPIGNLLPEQESHLAKLSKRPNFHLLGGKPRSQLPAYVHSLTVGLLCYRTAGNWARYGYPLKLHEYLAAGLPIVSADLLAVREFQNVISIAHSHEEWRRCISLQLSSDCPGKQKMRQLVAKENDWENRSALLGKLLTDLVNRNGTPT